MNSLDAHTLSADDKLPKIDSTANNGTSSTTTIWFLSGPLVSGEIQRHIPICDDRFLVGRRADVSLSLSSRTVSSIHAELSPNDEHLLLIDHGSTNGTYVNAERIAGRAVVRAGDLVQFAEFPFRVLRQSALKQSATVSQDVLGDALALVQFEQLLRDEAVVPHYQPIVELSDERIMGFEVLGRSEVPGLETPAAMFSAAAQLSLETKLSQMLRSHGVQRSHKCAQRPHLFLNTHPAELREPGLIESIKAIRNCNTSQEITLEIHEAAVADAASMKQLRAELKDLDVGLAFDDFGAGQARLVELTEVQPDYLKFDMSLIRDIHVACDEHKQMIASLVHMVCDLGIRPLAEGIESRDEGECCKELGFELAQGFLYGRPVAIVVDDS